MDFSSTEEQSLLRDTVASYLADHYSFDQRRAMLAKESGWNPAIWKAFAEELGILGAPFSEELGGLGGGPVENMIVMQEMGKALVVEPYLGTVVIGGGFLKHSGHAGAEALIAQIIAGEAIFAFAYAVFLVGYKVLHGQPIQGWTSIMVALAFFSGVQLVSLGILGEYLWRTLDAARARKGFLVRDRTNSSGSRARSTPSSCRTFRPRPPR